MNLPAHTPLSPEHLRLRQALLSCRSHGMGLGEALEDIGPLALSAADLQCLSRSYRRLLDQFAYRFTRLQDDMGAQLMPALLAALAEDIASMSTLDRLNRLEQLGWLSDAEEWSTLRRIRNEFTHDYPESPELRHERLQLALKAAARLLDLFNSFEDKMNRRFPELVS